MLKNKYLYTKLAAFASKDKARPIFNYLNFTGEEVVATNTHWLAVAKGYKAEPHMESTDDVLILGTGVRCAEDLDHRTIKNFVNDEFPPKVKPADDDDLDFLD